MIEFWLSIGIVIFFVCSSIVFPLLRREEIKQSRLDANSDIIEYKDQLNEVDQDYKNGLLNQKQAKELQNELKRRIILANKSKIELPLAQSLSRRKYILVAFSSTCVCSIGSVLLYLQLGQPGLSNLSYSSRSIPSQSVNNNYNKTTIEIQKKIGGLLDQLETTPKDKATWIRLSQILIGIGKYNKAEEALYMAYKLDPNSATISADYAESRILNANGKVNKDTLNILNIAYKKTPSNPKILFYLGHGKAQAKDFRGALGNWTDLIFLSDKNDPWIPAVKKKIAIALEKSGYNPLSIKPSQTARTIAKMRKLRSVGTLSPSSVEAASKMNFEDRSNIIKNMVEQLATRLKENPNDPEGWARLAKAYTVLGDELKAKKAREKFNALRHQEEKDNPN